MGLTQRKRYPGAQARRGKTSPGSAANVIKRTPITLLDAAVSTPTVVLTLDQVVIVNGVPQYPNDNGDMPDTASMTGPEEVTLHYPSATVSLTVPFEDPAIRNGVGGYVLPGTFPPE